MFRKQFKNRAYFKFGTLPKLTVTIRDDRLGIHRERQPKIKFRTFIESLINSNYQVEVPKRNQLAIFEIQSQIMTYLEVNYNWEMSVCRTKSIIVGTLNLSVQPPPLVGKLRNSSLG